MRGFTGEYYNGIPVFIREEYERAHIGDGELERIEDLTGNLFGSINDAIFWLESNSENQLYRRRSEAIDSRLRMGAGHRVWVPYRDGYVHVITGEYVQGMSEPCRESRPCWSMFGVDHYHTSGDEAINAGMSMLEAFCLFVGLRR